MTFYNLHIYMIISKKKMLLLFKAKAKLPKKIYTYVCCSR